MTTTGVDVDRLQRLWDAPPTVAGWLTMVNHKTIGKRFLVTGTVFFVLGGIFALIMRVQLALPELEIINPQVYNELFTMHGVTMAFLFIVPVLEGFGIFILPLMVGARDLPFPRLTAFGYWVYLLAGVFIFSSVFVGAIPDGGWYAYVPFTGPEFTPGLSMDFWLLGITFLEISAISAGIEIAALLFKNRAPGMTIARMPVFAWSMLVTSFIIIFAFPTLIVGSILLEVERKLGTPFYNPDLGGNEILWQHLFWWFGHPDVYIWLLPGVGIISMIVPTFARTRLVGYTWVVASTVVAGVLSFGVWVHHMFTVGLPLLTISFFGGASLVFALPSGVQVFSWIATIWRGERIRWTTPMLFAAGTILVFTFGGISGVMLGVVPFNWQAHDTHFVVAHFHYVLVGGSVLPMFAGTYYWWPKLTGRLLSEHLGRWHFWLFLAGLNLTFFPLHVLGFLGMPRRVYTYLEGLGWGPLNLVATVGAFLTAAGVLVFIVNAVVSQRRPIADPDPWGSGSLEWAGPTLPPTYNFAAYPVVRSRYPLWDQPSVEADDELTQRWTQPMATPLNDEREILVTSEIDAQPQTVAILPQKSFWPIFVSAALAVALAGVLADIYWIAGVGVAASVKGAVSWAWNNDDFRPIDWPDGL